MRHSLLSVVAGILFLGIMVAMLMSAGCKGQPPLSGDIKTSEARSQQLMILAAEEAAAITDVDARLTRQLNLADQQIRRGWPTDARTTLSGASQTLTKDGKALNNHARISGWVAVSELSRQAADDAAGLKAVDQAVIELLAIEDPAQRCQYVMGLANELQYLKGRSAAAELLGKSGPWAREIDSTPQRRQALVAFSSALFNLDDYKAGQAVLRQDDDAAWRSDMLVTLAAPVEKKARHQDRQQMPAALMSMEQSQADAPATSVPSYGQKLNYRDVFQDQKRSRTQQD